MTFYVATLDHLIELDHFPSTVSPRCPPAIAKQSNYCFNQRVREKTRAHEFGKRTKEGITLTMKNSLPLIGMNKKN